MNDINLSTIYFIRKLRSIFDNIKKLKALCVL